MTAEKKRRIEFGDFQTPRTLANLVCHHLRGHGIRPDIIVEPTCGVGAFVLASAEIFPGVKQVYGYDINEDYLAVLRSRLNVKDSLPSVHLERTDFFSTDWRGRFQGVQGRLLVVGNFPWVTSSTQSGIGGKNLPEKTNFLGFSGFDAISGKSNFDISEWMLLQVLSWLSPRGGDLAMLVKTSVARKVLAYAERQRLPVVGAQIVEIDAKRHFGVSVDACLLVIRLDLTGEVSYDYTVYSDFSATQGRKVGHRQGLTVSDLDAFELCAPLLGKSPQKWRSGIKHDASAIMELTRTDAGYQNALGEVVQLEDAYLFPLMKGADIGSNKDWRNRFVLVTQRTVGSDTDVIRLLAPKTWAYLSRHSAQLDARGSVIYARNPRFSVFGVGDYAFRPWRIAICALYKALRFRLVSPVEERPVMFDDTVYYISFETEAEARRTLAALQSEQAMALLSSLIFWDEKRPIKTSILNLLDWSRLGEEPVEQAS